MRGRWRCRARCAWALAAAVGLVSSAEAARLRLDRVAATSQGFVYVEFEFEAPFEGIYQDALSSGLPTTLNYTIEVWQQRSGWWDKLEAAYERRFRILRDLLNDLYYVVTPEEALHFTHVDSLTAYVSRVARGPSSNEPPYFGRHLFQDGKTYYVVVTATLAPLTVEDLNQLDAWLRGTIRGKNDGTGGITGLTQTMGGMIVGMTGFGDKRVKTRSPRFKPAELPREPPAPAAPPAVAPNNERRLAAPDSGISP